MEMKPVVTVRGRAGGNVTWMAKGSNRISHVFPLQRNVWHKLKGTSRRGQQNVYLQVNTALSKSN